MAERLRSILRPTHWSSLTKAIVFGGAWWVLPFWGFLAIAAFLYFQPWFQSLKLLFPFGVLLALAGLFEPNAWLALLLAIGFYLILAIKEFLIIRRFEAYQFLVLDLVFLSLLKMFLSPAGEWGTTGAALRGLTVALEFLLLMVAASSFLPSESKAEELFRFEALGLVCAFLFWQLLLVLNLFPFDAFSQTAVAAAAAGVLMEFLFAYAQRQLTRSLVLSGASVFFLVMVLVLA